MRNRTVVTLVAAAALLSVQPPAAQAENLNLQITICHVAADPSDVETTLSVSIFAVPPHLAHRDRLGACEGGGPTP